MSRVISARRSLSEVRTIVLITRVVLRTMPTIIAAFSSAVTIRFSATVEIVIAVVVIILTTREFVLIILMIAPRRWTKKVTTISLIRGWIIVVSRITPALLVVIPSIMWIEVGIIPSVIGVGIVIIAPTGIIIPTILIIRIVYITVIVNMCNRGMVVIMPCVTTIVTSTSILGNRNNCATETIHDIFILMMRRRLEHEMC